MPYEQSALRAELESQMPPEPGRALPRRPVAVGRPTALDAALTTTPAESDVRGPNDQTMKLVMAGFLSGDPVMQKASKIYYNSRVPKKQRTRYFSTNQGVYDTKEGRFIRDDEFIKGQRAYDIEKAERGAVAAAAEWGRRTGIKEENIRTRPKTVPPTVQEKILKQDESIRILDTLLAPGDKGGLKEEFSGGPTFWDEFQNKVAAMAEFVAPDSWVDQNNWWSMYRKNFEMPEIHELFGAVLTTGEEARYKAAAVRPEMSGTTIRKKLRIQQDMIKEWSKRQRGMAADTYNRPELATSPQREKTLGESVTENYDKAEGTTPRRRYIPGKGFQDVP